MSATTTTRARFTWIVAALAVLAAVVITWWQSDDASPASLAPDFAEAQPADPGAGGDETSRVGAREPTRGVADADRAGGVEPADRRGETARGDLLVRVVAGSSRTPVARAAVWFERPGAAALDSEPLLTDDRGEVRFVDVAVGSVAVSTDRQPYRSGPRDVEISAGGVTEVTFEVASGTAVRVRVEDERGAPVPAAEVLLWPANGYLDIPDREPGRVVGRTDAAGQLELTALPQLDTVTHASWLAARHANLGASPARMISAVTAEDSASEQGPRDLTLRLQSSGSWLSVAVRDGEGVAVPGARVELRAVDALSSREDEVGRVLDAVCRDAVTGPRGLCRVGPCVAGSWRVHVRGPRGFATAIEPVELDGATDVHRDVRLEPGAEILGQVVSSVDRTPIRLARVRLRQGRLRLDVRSGHDGRFRVTELSPGPFRWAASADGFAGSEADFEAPGELVVALAPLGSIRLECVDERGVAVASGFDVELEAPLVGQTDRRRGTLDARGQLTLRARQQQDYRLTLFENGIGLPLPIPDPGPLRVRSEPWQIVVPQSARATAHAVGRLVDRAGAPAIAGCQLDLVREAVPPSRRIYRARGERSSFAVATDPANGTFEFGPAPAGDFVLRMRNANGLEWTVPAVRLVAGRRTDLGTLQVPESGELLVTVVPDEGVDLGDVRVEVERVGAPDRLLRVDSESLVGRATLLPGSVDVTVYGTGFRWVREQVRIADGEVANVRAVLRAARRVGLRVAPPDGETSIAWTLRDGRGALVEEAESDAESAAWNHTLWPFLDVGRFEVVAIGGSGQGFRGSFTVDSLDDSDQVVNVELTAR